MLIFKKVISPLISALTLYVGKGGGGVRPTPPTPPPPPLPTPMLSPYFGLGLGEGSFQKFLFYTEAGGVIGPTQSLPSVLVFTFSCSSRNRPKKRIFN